MEDHDIRTYTEFTFEAAHMVEGISGLHGHTFVCRLTFVGRNDPTYGWPVNLYAVRQSIQALKNRIGQADENGDNEGEGNLCDIPEIGNVASLEHVTRWIWSVLKPRHDELVEIDLNRGFRGSIEGCVYSG